MNMHEFTAATIRDHSGNIVPVLILAKDRPGTGHGLPPLVLAILVKT